jgi:outer membrane lipoprotein-sorting protein
MMMSPMRRLLAAFVVAFGLGFVLALATPAFAAPLSEQDKADIARVEAYLNGFRSLQSDFVQIAQDGGMAEGTVYMERPNRIRVDYAPPVPVLMVGSGNWITFYDKELKQSNRVPLNSNPLSMLLAKEVRFADPVEVTRVTRGANVLEITVRDRQHPQEGELTMVFADNPLQFRKWVVKDKAGQETTVALANARFDVAIDPKLFTHARELEDLR